jgi:hypothetical protein
LTTATLKVAAVELPSALVVEHVCPLALENVMTTMLVFDASEPVPTQVVARFPLPVGVSSTMAGDVLEVVNPAGKVTVIVLLDLSRPEEDVVKPTVQVDAVFATSELGAVPVNVTAESDDALALTTFVSAVRSSVVSAAATTA